MNRMVIKLHLVESLVFVCSFHTTLEAARDHTKPNSNFPKGFLRVCLQNFVVMTLDLCLKQAMTGNAKLGESNGLVYLSSLVLKYPKAP